MAEVVIVGNPFDGMTLHGPFSSGLEAQLWVENNATGDDWWITTLEAPESWPARES